jgi:hypothetical protein
MEAIIWHSGRTDNTSVHDFGRFLQGITKPLAGLTSGKPEGKKQSSPLPKSICLLFSAKSNTSDNSLYQVQFRHS